LKIRLAWTITKRPYSLSLGNENKLGVRFLSIHDNMNTQTATGKVYF